MTVTLALTPTPDQRSTCLSFCQTPRPVSKLHDWFKSEPWIGIEYAEIKTAHVSGIEHSNSEQSNFVEISLVDIIT